MEYWVVSAGEVRSKAFWQQSLKRAEHIISADGGFNHCRAFGARPDLVVGDLDSLDSEPDGVEVRRFARDKALSDTQIAIEHAFAAGADRVYLLGATGGRLDHSFANLKLLSSHPNRLIMLDGDFEALCLTESYSFQGEIGQLCSLIPAGTEEASVTTAGLKFALRQQPLRPDSHGLSNLLTAKNARIEVHEGKVVLMRNWQLGSNRRL